MDTTVLFVSDLKSGPSDTQSNGCFSQACGALAPLHILKGLMRNKNGAEKAHSCASGQDVSQM